MYRRKKPNIPATPAIPSALMLVIIIGLAVFITMFVTEKPNSMKGQPVEKNLPGQSAPTPR